MKGPTKNDKTLWYQKKKIAIQSFRWYRKTLY
jgi:hypothetical protein